MRALWAALIVLCAGCAAGGSGDWPLRAQVFPAAVAPTSAPAPATVTIATYNLHELHDPADLRDDLARIDADVWLFQEVRIAANASDHAADELRTLLPASSRWNIVLVAVNPTTSGVEAQAIATRLPIDRAEVWPLDASPRRRCALAVAVRVGERELLLVNTDHAPGYFSFTIAHEPQLRSLAERLSDQSASAVVLGGDFNTCGNFWRFRSSQADAVAARGDLRAQGLTPATAEPLVTFSAGPIRGYLDAMYVRGVTALDAAVINSTRGSDHHPLVARVSWAER